MKKIISISTATFFGHSADNFSGVHQSSEDVMLPFVIDKYKDGMASGIIYGRDDDTGEVIEFAKHSMPMEEATYSALNPFDESRLDEYIDSFKLIMQ